MITKILHKPTTKILISLMAFIKLTIQSEDCKITQPCITFGDYFSPQYKNASNYYTVSAVIRGENCTPKLEITKITGTKITLDPVEKNFYLSRDLNYSATSYFFSVPFSLRSTANTWRLTSSTDTTPFNFMPNQGSFNPPNEANFVFIADMDISIISKPLLDRMSTWTGASYDFVLHGGDFAYEIDTRHGAKGDEFFEVLSEKFSTKIPYVVTPGNHERYDLGRLFNFRFKAPGSGNHYLQGTNYFSFRYKGVHYVTFNTDYAFILHPEEKLKIFNWLENDLKQADSDPEVNFIVFYTHRPSYCPYVYDDNCKVFYHTRPFDALLMKYNVDLYITAHVHAYIRLKKLKEFEIVEGPEADKLPLQIVAGSAGAIDDPKNIPLAPMADYFYFGTSAFLRVKTNQDKIYGEFIHSKDGKILDSFELVNKRKKKRVDIGGGKK